MFAPFDTITGSSIGGVSAREMAAEIIATGAPFTGPSDLLELWEELARTTDDEIDLDSYTDGLNALCDEHDLLPPYCALIWQDNELRVTPCVEWAREDLAVYDAGDEHVTEDLWLEVTDHGNVSLYARDPSSGLSREIWSVV